MKSSALTPRKTTEINQKTTKADTTAAVAAALHDHFRNMSAPISRIQQIGGVDRNTASAWYHGHSEPSFHQIINMARQIPELKGEVRRLLQLEADMHEDIQREFTLFMQRVMKR